MCSGFYGPFEAMKRAYARLMIRRGFRVKKRRVYKDHICRVDFALEGWFIRTLLGGQYLTARLKGPFAELFEG